MTVAMLTSKGQITIPVSVRKALRVDAGDRIEFVEIGPGRFEMMAATLPVTALKGLVGARAAPVSIEAMNAAIRARAGRGV